MDVEQKRKNPPKILIVDDISVNVKLLAKMMVSQGYEPLCALNVQDALDLMNESMPDLILSDYSMPGMNGLEFCKLLKSSAKTREIPFIFITVADSGEEKQAAFEAGAADFIPKPFERIEVIMRVNNALNTYYIKQEMEAYNRMMNKMMEDQKKQMDKERQNVLIALATIVERRGASRGEHLERVAYNSRVLAQSLQLTPKYEKLISDDFVETIGPAARLHDIGYIMLADNAGAKETETGEEKRDFVGIHVEEGANILEQINQGDMASRFLEMAVKVARYHHAHWDGSGYPAGAEGTDIPLAARIVALANDFDILLKHPGDEHITEECIKKISDNAGILYDPDIVEVFCKVIKRLRTD